MPVVAVKHCRIHFIYISNMYISIFQLSKSLQFSYLAGQHHLEILEDSLQPVASPVGVAGNNPVFFIDFSNFQCKSINNRYATGGIMPDL